MEPCIGSKACEYWLDSLLNFAAATNRLDSACTEFGNVVALPERATLPIRRLYLSDGDYGDTKQASHPHVNLVETCSLGWF